MVCIWRHGGHVEGTTQRNMLLIPLSNPAGVGGWHCPLHPERLIANQELLYRACFVLKKTCGPDPLQPARWSIYMAELVNSYTAKIRSCWKQDATMLLGQHCSMLSTILFGIVTPDCGLIQAQQYCSILLTTRNNVAPTTLLHPVFNNLLQLIIFCRVQNNTEQLICFVPCIKFKLEKTLNCLLRLLVSWKLCPHWISPHAF